MRSERSDITQEVPGFHEVGHGRIFGVDYLAYGNDDDIAMLTPRSSQTALRDQPELVETIYSTARFMAEHNGYKSPADVVAIQSVRTIHAATPAGDYRGAGQATSVYDVKTSNTIIKAYDLSPDRQAVTEFGLGSRLHDEFSNTDRYPHLTAPMPYALLQSPGKPGIPKHYAVIMEKLAGVSCHEVSRTLDEQDRQRALAVRDVIHGRLDKALASVPPQLKIFMDDIAGSAPHNVLVPLKTEDVSFETAAEVSDFAVIDPANDLSIRTWTLSHIVGFGRIKQLLNTRIR
jgi:hypothetical protein